MRIQNYHFTFLFGFGCVLTLSLLPFYNDGAVILGGEGNYILDYSQHLKTTFHQWFSRFGLGTVNLSPGSTMAHFFFLVLIENLFQNQALTNFLLIFLMYFLPFLGMYLISAELGIRPYLCGLVSLFYVINPFSIYFLSSLNQWNNFAIFLIPILFWVVLRYYHDSLKLFLYYGSISAFFSIAYTNTPLNAIINISTIISVYLTSCYYNKKIELLEIIKKYLLVFSAFLLFNCWWLLNMFKGVDTALVIYKADIAKRWLIGTVNSVESPLARSLSITHMTGTKGEAFLFSDYFQTPITFFIGLIPIFLVVSGFFFSKKTNMHKLLSHTLILMLITVFLLKGAAPPLGNIYLFLFDNVPFFNIFKSPIEKFGLLYTFLLSLLVLFTLLATKSSKYYRTGIIIFTVYILFCMGPLLMGNIIPESTAGSGYGTISRKHNIKPEYQSFREYINKQKLEYKVLSLPGLGNYQVLYNSSQGKKYSGIDPLLKNINKPILEAQYDNEITEFYKTMLDKNSPHLFGSFNIGRLDINGDTLPWFGLLSANPEKLREHYKGLSRKNFGNISTHTLSQSFIPVVHTTENIIIQNKRPH